MDKRILDLKSINEKLNKDLEDVENEMEEELHIDIYNLEKECAMHSGLFHQVAMVASKVGLQLARAELLVKELKAEIATDIRSNPEGYGITKLTEGQVMEAIDSSEFAKEARQMRAQFGYLKNRADSLVQAFEHKRSMLNNEVQLYMSKLSEPNVQARRNYVQSEIMKKREK